MSFLEYRRAVSGSVNEKRIVQYAPCQNSVSESSRPGCSPVDTRGERLNSLRVFVRTVEAKLQWPARSGITLCDAAVKFTSHMYINSWLMTRLQALRRIVLTLIIPCPEDSDDQHTPWLIFLPVAASEVVAKLNGHCARAVQVAPVNSRHGEGVTA